MHLENALFACAQLSPDPHHRLCPPKTDQPPATSTADWGSSESSGSDTSSSSSQSVRVKVAPGGAAAGSSIRRLLNASKEVLIAEERVLLQDVVGLLEAVAPQVGKVCLQRGTPRARWSSWTVCTTPAHTHPARLPGTPPTHTHTNHPMPHAPSHQQMDELPLLRDAITNLDDVFLVVVVGEFNSGKSTVINALLGERFLADGILPTTNEISVLK